MAKKISELPVVDSPQASDRVLINHDGVTSTTPVSALYPEEEIDESPTEGSTNPVTSGGVYEALSGKQAQLTFDNTPTRNSDNPVKSGGIYTALETLGASISGKQDTLTVDDAPTEDSTNLVTSGGVYEALTGKQDTLTIDSAMSDSSTNPVQNKIIKAYVDNGLSDKQDTLTFDNTPTNNSTNPVTSGGVYAALSGIQGSLTFDEIPTEDSSNPVTSGGVYEALKNSGAQSDWEEGNSAAPGYINNRPFYTEPVFSNLGWYGQYLKENEGNLQILSKSFLYGLIADIKTGVYYPSASKDGSFPLVDDLDLTYYSKSTYPSYPTDLDTSRRYQIYLDDELIYEGKPRETSDGFWESSDERASGSYKVLGSIADGVMVYTRQYSDYSNITVNAQWLLYSKGVYWYFFMPVKAAAKRLSLKLKRQTNETVTQIPIKYIPVENSVKYNSEYPITSGSVYLALNNKQNLLNFDSEPTSSSYNPVISRGIYSAIRNAVRDVTGSISDLADIIDTLKNRVSDLETAMEEKEGEISSLRSRVARLESLHGGDGSTANVSDGILALDGDSVGVDEDGCLSLTSSGVTVDDNGVLSIESMAESATVDNGTLAVSGAEVDSDGSLTMSGSATVDDGTLTV